MISVKDKLFSRILLAIFSKMTFMSAESSSA